MGPSLSFDIPVGHFMMHNNVNLNSGFHAEYSDYQNGVGGDSWQGFHSAPLIHQNIYQRGDQGIYILHRVAAVEAIHDSAESFPQPRCHPETRTKMLEDLYEWAVDPHPQSTVLWLYGPAGAGKSAIMQTLARQLQDAGRLAGSFFFKRGHATRGNAKTLFATIAYQLALSVLSLRMRISQIVEHNPSILIRSMQTQMDKLILEPCRLHGNRDSMTILIDGLDECEGHDVQREILSAIRTVRATNFLSLRFIVASRPEPHICEGFNTPVYVGNYRSFNVEQSFEDVRKYLCDEFSRIHREHRTMASVAHPWPSPDLLDELVDRSSGHFIYAATIINFIDDKNYRPTQQLKAVQEGNIVGSTPAFDTLDQLYMTILSSTPRQAELIPILCAIVNFDLRLHEVDQLFALEDDEAGLLLRGLHSVLHVPSEDGRRSSISSHHASFLDFLNNPSRSHHFYVGDLDHRMAVARSFLRLCASGRYEPPWSHKRYVQLGVKRSISYLLQKHPLGPLDLISRLAASNP
ncbi:hypothetical protein C8R45DRAFT_202325 [Mycena sanguinolenta]|nr:hypothetical protein C8R45DRAFT_202325 [Mycena sanguinolenta]